MVRGTFMGAMILALVLWLVPGAGAAETKGPAAKAKAPAAETKIPGTEAKAPVYNLQQLLVMALTYSPQVKATKSEVDLAKEQKAEAHAYRFPQFDAIAVGGVIPNAQRGQIRNVDPNGNATLFYPDPKGAIHGVNVFGNVTFTLVQPLYTFGKIAYRERAAEKNVHIKQVEVDKTRGEVIYNVSHAYYGLILANQGKDAVADAKTYLSDARQRITRLLQAGSPNVRDTDRYRLAMYEGGVEKFAAQAEEGSKVAYKALKQLTGAERDFQVPTELPAPVKPPAGLDYYIQSAFELRPELNQVKEGLIARQLLVEGAKADRYPSFFFAVMGQIAGAPGHKYNPDPYNLDFFNDTGALPVLGAKWHFDFGILKAKIGQAQAELNQLRHQERAAVMGIPIEVARDYGKLVENYKGAQGTEQAYINARRWLVASFSNFDMGVGNMDEIFRAFERYGAFRGDYLQSLFDYNMAVAKLDQDTGLFRRAVPVGTPGATSGVSPRTSIGIEEPKPGTEAAQPETPAATPAAAPLAPQPALPPAK